MAEPTPERTQGDAGARHRRGFPRWLAVVLGAIVGIVGLVAIGLFVLTRTDWGREKVRAFAIGKLASQVAGNVTVDRLSGNLLTGATLAGVSITDSSGAPFLKADTISLRYSLRSFLSKQLVFNDVRLVDPLIVLDQPPGKKWNFERLFPHDTTSTDTVPGFGSWLRINDLTLVDGTMVVRQAWSPPDTLRGAARARYVAEATSPSNRRWIVRVPNGWQTLSVFNDVDAKVPYLRLADPDSAARLIDVDSLDMVAFVFRPPPAQVRQLSGRFVIGTDSIGFHDVFLALPHSRLTLRGAYALDASGLWAQVSSAPTFAFQDLRFVYPEAPPGGGKVGLAVVRHEDRTRIVAQNLDVESQGAHATGRADVQLGDELRIGSSDLAFSGVTTRLIRSYTDAKPPVNGTLAGHVRLAGEPSNLNVDGWAAFDAVGGPTSRVDADGRVLNGPGGVRARDLRLRFEPLALGLVEAFGPDLPVGGFLRGRATLNGALEGPLDLNADVVHEGGGTGRSHVLADGRILLDGGVETRGLALRFDPLQAALVRRFAPSAPLRGALVGRATLNGDPRGRLAVDANVVNVDPAAGRSHVLADGLLLLGGASTAMRDLKVRMQPLQLGLVQRVSPTFPVKGTVAGTATLNGSLGGRIAASFDAVLDAPSGRSRLVGRTVVNAQAPKSFFNVRLERPTDVALATVGQFAPSAGLKGRAAGAISLQGPMSDLDFALDVAVSGGGTVTGNGTIDLASATPSYDLQAALGAFDAAAVSTRAPATLLNGTIAARGAGTDPATMNALLRADLVDLRLKGQTLDTTHVLARIDEGLATVERGHVALASATADVGGTFGLIGSRTGTLTFAVEVDSLGEFAALGPADTTVYPPRPRLQARALSRARADSARVAEATMVERAATGYPPPPRLKLDTVPALRADSLAGRLVARGTLTGNIERFDARGTATADHVVAAGSAVAQGNATFTLLGFGTPDASLRFDAQLDSVRTGGFAFDSAGAHVAYTGVRDRGHGTANVALFQDTASDYRLAASFLLELDRREVRFDSLVMRFDTTFWRATRPGTVTWRGPGIEVDSISLASNTGGRIFVDGQLPVDAPADLRLDVDRLQIGDVTALLQDTMTATGLLSLHARVQGTQRAPTFSGTALLDDGTYGGTPLPDVTGTFAYANTELTAHAEATADTTGLRLLTADARLPINLALAGYTGPRLLDRPLVVDARADSLPLQALPNLTAAVTDLTGLVHGQVAVRGTFQDPAVSGQVALAHGTMRIDYPNILLEDVNGLVTLRGDSALVDSLVARSAGGRLTADGALYFATLARPTFDLAVRSRRALVLDNKQGTIRADADLTVKGPYDRLAVGGTARVLDGVVYAPESTNHRVTNLEDPLALQALDTTALAGILPKPNPLLENLTVDVALSVNRNTWVRNTSGNVEIYTPEGGPPLQVRMDRKAQTLTLLGAINADRGEYTFAGRTFRLTTGSMTFLGGPTLDPLLQLSAQYEVQRPQREALIIQIHVLGALTEPRVTLESNAQPPLTQSDLISYLAFGRTSGSLLDVSGSSVTSGQRTLGGLTALAQQQLGPLALGSFVDQAVSEFEHEGSRAGLDVFRLHPGDIPDEFAFDNYFSNLVRGTRYEAGKYLSRRLYVSLDGDFNNVPGLGIEYQTPGGFSWQTTWEPRYLPGRPTLSNTVTSTRARTFGTFFFWTRRF